MNKVTNLRYLLTNVPKTIPPKDCKTKPVHTPVTIIPTTAGIEKRLNSANTFEFPKSFTQKNKPEFLVGTIIRISYLIA
jgi:hypothetical protein